MEIMTSNDPVKNDPLGKAIIDFQKTGIPGNIIVESDTIDDDVLPSDYLFRDYDNMPALEQLALAECKGRVLDVGAGSGAHTKHLISKGFDVMAIDTSFGAVAAMRSQGINTQLIDFFELKDEKFDTLLFLMNGTGIAGELENFSKMLIHCRSLLNDGGKILIDSTDIHYIYEDEDGSVWIDLNGSYYGEVQFNMKYKDQESGWFNWLYLDQDTLNNIAKENGYKTTILFENDDQYLAELTIN